MTRGRIIAIRPHMPLKQKGRWQHTGEHARSAVQTTGPPVLRAIRALKNLDAIANSEVEVAVGLRGKIVQRDDVVYRRGFGLERRGWRRCTLRCRGSGCCCCPKGGGGRGRGGVWGRCCHGGYGRGVCIDRLTRAERSGWGRRHLL
jgi:hypothetical protein